MTPPAKRQRTETSAEGVPASPAEDFDEFTVPDAVLLDAVEAAERDARGKGGIAAHATKPSPVTKQASLPFGSPTPTRPASEGSTDAPPPYTLPYAGTPDDPLALERMTMNEEWFDRLQSAMHQDSFKKLKQFLDGEKRAGHTIYPPPHLIHSWSRTTPLEHVKVVILGQDPYHQPGQACGHSFSVPMGKAVPASLRNIYKELQTEYPSFRPPSHGCLTGWANQGVLLLNACLGWEPFTREILKAVAQAAAGRGPGGGPLDAMLAGKTPSPQGPQHGVVFLAWGLPAARSLAEAGITERSPNVLLLRSPHPSPLSAHRGFLGNGHFAKANAWLEDKARYGPGGGIQWGDL